MKLIDKNNEKPIYIQLEEVIKEMIDKNILKQGEYLMPERELAKYQSISRMTVNKVVKNLVNDGFLDRIQGKGTFVAYKKEVHKFQNLKGFTEVMNEKGVKVKNEILSFEVLEPSEKILNKLQIKNELVYKIERLRIIDNTPFAFETVYIPTKACKDLSYEKLKDNSLYSLLEGRYNQEIKNANQIINPVLLNKKEAKILNRNINLPSLRFDRVAFNQNDEAIEYTISIFTCDKYQYEMVLSK
ncbi:MAG: GntR family transcriptional regulator [Peptostreptococcaceae bacterium]